MLAKTKAGGALSRGDSQNDDRGPNLSSCPNCGRKARKALTSNFFPVHTCLKCGKKYCNDCGKGGGTTCPKCGSKDHSDLDKVFA